MSVDAYSEWALLPENGYEKVESRWKSKVFADRVLEIRKGGFFRSKLDKERGELKLQEVELLEALDALEMRIERLEGNDA